MSDYRKLSGILAGYVKMEMNNGPWRQCELMEQTRGDSGQEISDLETNGCSKVVKKDVDLTTETSHKNEDRNYRCQYCAAEFSRSEDMKRHIRIHTGERKYKCEECGAAFSENGTLKKHLRTHTGEKNYKCELCGAAFSQSSTLKAHTRTHTGEKGYKCDLCGAAFSHSFSLNRHLLIHSGEKNYKCHVCGASFSQSSNLKTHIVIHIGEKSFKCQCCGAEFLRRDDLKKHDRIHTGEKNYKCVYCCISFSRNSNLRMHTLRKHAGIRQFSESVGDSETTACSQNDSGVVGTAVQCCSDDVSESGDSLLQVEELDTSKYAVDFSCGEKVEMDIPTDDLGNNQVKCEIAYASDNIDTTGEIEDFEKKEG